MLFRAEKEMVRHVRVKHPGESYVRTPNLEYCFKVDLTKVAEFKYEDTFDCLLPNEDRTKKKKSTKSKLKSTQPKPAHLESAKPKPKRTPKPKETPKKTP